MKGHFMIFRHDSWCRALIVALCCAAISAPLSAQNDVANATNKAALNKLSIQFKKRSEAARKHARNVAKRSNLPVRQDLPDGGVMEIQRISPTGKPVFYITNNADAADTVSTDEVHPGGLTGLNLDGSGMKVGEWDEAAVLSSHQEFTGRVTQVDTPSTTSDFHASHVAGTLIAAGVVPAARGMAYAASLDAWDWDDDTSEMATAAASGMLLSNHSYGNATGWLETITGWWWLGGPLDSDVEDYNFGYYNTDAQAWDQIAFNAPYYLIVKSIGNDRDDFGPAPGIPYRIVDGSGDTPIDLGGSTEPRNPDCYPAGYDCTPTISTAKNILTVGAVDVILGGYTSSGDVIMSDFSGWGPTDDGRIKPDIVANGVGLYSPIALPWPFDYFELDGTSMAAPNVTGSLLLLQEHYQNLHTSNSMRAATLKALAIHTADEAGTAAGPDYQHGWGLLNTKLAAQVITEDGGGHRIIEDTLTAEPGSKNIIQINVNEPDAEVTATLVWTDAPGTPVTPEGVLDPTDKMLVNDLDLRIHDASSTHLPWLLNPAFPASAATTGDNDRDNVEQVEINGGGPGAYFVEVRHKGTLLNGVNQNYSLIISVVARQVFTTTTITLANEDFTAGLPGGWSTSKSGGGAIWTVVSPSPGDQRADNLTGGTGNFAWVDNNFQITDTELRTTTFDMSSYTKISLKFKSHFVFSEYETANVDVSTDDGANWTNVWQLIGFTPPSTYFIDLTNDSAGQSSVLIRFRYETAGQYFGDFWQIDDVEITGTFFTVIPGDVCSKNYNLPANQWRFISLPCDPGTSNSVSDIFGDDFPADTYDVSWVIFKRDELNDQYIRITDPATSLQQGKGYFFYSLNASLLDVAGTATTLTTRADCPSPDNKCFVIPLVKPVNDTSTLFNALGHPLPYPVDWADFRIVAADGTGSPMTPSEALANNYLSKVAHKYTGSAYVPYDDVTPGYDEGALGAYDGFWVETLGDSFHADLVLLVPNMRSPGVITTDTVAASTLESTTLATSTSVKTKVPPGLAKREAHRQSHRDAIKKNEEWYVRLTVEAAAEQLKDDGNILGQLYDSEFGYDQHDLVETPPNTPYLTIIFPQITWSENADDYTSDYHPVTPKKVLDQWAFEVRSDDPAREVRLEWTGSDEIFGMSWLIDQDTGEVIEPDSRGSYTFIMNGQKRYFTWEYEKRPGNSPRKH